MILFLSTQFGIDNGLRLLRESVIQEVANENRGLAAILTGRIQSRAAMPESSPGFLLDTTERASRLRGILATFCVFARNPRNLSNWRKVEAPHFRTSGPLVARRFFF